MSLAYLTLPWIEAADALLRSAAIEPPLDGPSFTVETATTDGPADARGYVLEFSGSTMRARPTKPGEQATVRLTQRYAVAAAVATGTTSAQAAFLSAEIQVGGDIGTLIANAGLIAQVGDALAPLRADTVYASV